MRKKGCQCIHNCQERTEVQILTSISELQLFESQEYQLRQFQWFTCTLSFLSNFATQSSEVFHSISAIVCHVLGGASPPGGAMGVVFLKMVFFHAGWVGGRRAS